jgi:hypothetical protein
MEEPPPIDPSLQPLEEDGPTETVPTPTPAIKQFYIIPLPTPVKKRRLRADAALRRVGNGIEVCLLASVTMARASGPPS